MASTNTKRNNKKEIADNELYNTPEIALTSFYEQYPEVFDQYKVYYDPCNGLGAISDFLKGIGKKVYTSDLEFYGVSDIEGLDFLGLVNIPEDVECFVFNPPFTLTEKFIDKVQEFKLPLVMFNRMTTIESKSRGIKFRNREWELDDMYQFSFRVSYTKGVNKEPTANSVAYAWFNFGVYNEDNHNNLDIPSATWLNWIV